MGITGLTVAVNRQMGVTKSPNTVRQVVVDISQLSDVEFEQLWDTLEADSNQAEQLKITMHLKRALLNNGNIQPGTAHDTKVKVPIQQIPEDQFVQMWHQADALTRKKMALLLKQKNGGGMAMPTGADSFENMSDILP